MLEGFRDRLLLMALACIMALGLMVPAFAFADDYEDGGGGSHGFGGSYPSWGTVWYGPNSTSNLVGTTYYQYGVVAYTKYDAAIYNLNINESIYGELTNKKKAKLISSDSAFTDFADTFKVGKPDLDPSLIFNTDYAVVTAWKSACDLYGETYCYSSMYTLAQKQAARDYVIGILGESDGGGSGGNPGTNETNFPTNQAVIVDDYALLPVMEWVADWPHQITHVAIKKEYFYAASEHALANGQMIFTGYGQYHSSTNNSLFVISMPYSAIDVTENGHYITYNSSWKGVKGYYLRDIGGVTYENIGGYECAVTDVGGSVATGQSVKEGIYPIAYCGWIYPEEEEVETPVTWPDPPTSPTVDPPEVPTPPEPDPPEPPDPTPPDPPTPWVPIPGPDDDPITGDEFQDLIDALAEHCKHIRDNVTDNVGQLWDNQSDLLVSEFSSTRDTLVDNMQWLGTDVIAKGFTDLSSYLNELFQWLADQMDFNVNVESNPYDDSSVVYWLKRIWSKLGTGDVNIRPTDPVTDNDGWWEYLLQLMDNFVSFLLGFGVDKLGDVGSALQTLTGKFPFSLPWDLAALFGLLVAPPQTPSIDFPQFTVDASGIQQVGTYHLSLESYNDAWEQVRWLERVSFCVLLIKSSDFFAGILGKVFGK